MDKQDSVKVVSTTKVSSIGIWSLAYTSFLYAAVLAVLWNVVVFLGYQTLSALNVIEKLDEKVASVAGDGAFKLSEALSLEKVMGVSLVLSVAVVLATPIFALVLGGIYSAVATFTGGVRINLTSTVLRTSEPSLAEVEAEVQEASVAPAPQDSRASAPPAENNEATEPPVVLPGTGRRMAEVSDEEFQRRRDAIGGYQSSGRRVTELPSPPAGPAAGARRAAPRDFPEAAAQ